MRIALSFFLILHGLLSFSQASAEKESLIEFTKNQLEEKAYAENVQFAIGIIDGEDEITFGLKKAVKWEEIENSKDIFEIGSVTKVFTSLLLAKVVEKGLIHLTDTIQEDLEVDWKETTPITYEMLANHTSGLPRIPDNFIKYAIMNAQNPYEKYDEEALIEYLEEKMSLNSKPGEKYAYSNVGAGLLSYLLCQKLNITYEEALQQMVFEPLSMEYSTTDLEKVEGDLVIGLDKKGKPTSNWAFDALAGAGAIKSNVEDMLKFMQSQLTDTTEAVQLMQTKTIEGDPFHMALGWHIITDNGFLWHNGGTGGYRSSVVLDPETNKGVVILTNISAGHKEAGFIDDLSFLIMEKL